MLFYSRLNYKNKSSRKKILPIKLCRFSNDFLHNEMPYFCTLTSIKTNLGIKFLLNILVKYCLHYSNMKFKEMVSVM